MENNEVAFDEAAFTKMKPNQVKSRKKELETKECRTQETVSTHNKFGPLVNELEDENQNPRNNAKYTNSAGPVKSCLKKSANGEQQQGQEKRVRFKSIKKKGMGTHKRKGKNKIKSLRILYANLNGIKDKVKSLEIAAKAYDAHIVAVAETKQLPPRLEGYGNWNSRERKNKGGGGVAITARNDINPKITKVENIEDEDQDVVWVELKKSTKESIFIGTYYGKQETASRDEIEREFDQLNTQINMLQNKGEVILTGDFNAKLEIKEKNHQQKISPNGKHLQNLINMNMLQTANINSESIGWTRQNRKNENEKSIIDYIIATEGIAAHIKETITDEKGTYRIKGKKESDHNTLLMEINTNIIKERKTIKRWKLDNKEGWEKFNNELEKYCDKNEPKTQHELQNTMKEIMKRTVGQATIRLGTKQKHESEKTVQLRAKKKLAKKQYHEALEMDRKNIPKKLDEYIKAQKELRTDIEENMKEKAKKNLQNMVQEGKLNSRNFWKMKSIVERSREPEPYNTITEDDRQLQGEQETKEYVARYFEDLYKARPGREEFKNKTTEIENKVREIEAEMRNKPEVDEFTEEELTNAIRKLKRKKSTGPDDMPNEIFIEANAHTRKILMNAFNKINKEMAIPDEWQKGEICRLFKGRGIKGKCSNERGITLSSNFGKLYERLINERINKIVYISDAQAGGKKGSATVDHLLLLKELINAGRREKKDVYIAYLDVAKAYDKAWLTGIMYAMYKEGLTDNHWTLVKRLNENLTAQLQTRFGLTREIKIKDSIRQGGVLSTTMYGLLMDEISKKVKEENIGIQIEGMDEKIGSLLWVDDVLLITTDNKEFQTSLDTTDNTSNEYHVEYGQSKSNTQFIKKRKSKLQEEEFKLGETPLEKTEKYKYLGYLQNSKNNNEDHIKQVKGKTEAAYQKMMALTGNSNFSMVEMESVWKVVEACISPIITYAGEIWEPSQSTYKPANQIMDGILKRILKTPISTPREALYIETGLLDPESIIKKNRISMEHRIMNGNNKTMVQILKLTNKESWAEQNRSLKQELGIEESDMENTKYHLRNALQNKIKTHLEEKLKASAENKSKMQFYLEGKQSWSTCKRAAYISKLTRNQASTIFKARTRMTKVKGNYKNGHKDLLCRLCGKNEETQKHILEECEKLKTVTKGISKEMIFVENVEELLETAVRIQKRMEILEDVQQKTSGGILEDAQQLTSTSRPLADASANGGCAHD